jgi:hypothetical protein
MTNMLPIYIVVDALDECSNFSGTPSASEEVPELIGELGDLKLSNVHLCVASRSEIDIRMVLESLRNGLSKFPFMTRAGKGGY